MIITRKVQLIPEGDKDEFNRVYDYIHNGQYAQNRAFNILIGAIYSATLNNASPDEIREIYKKGGRDPRGKLESLYPSPDSEYGIKFPVGLGTPSNAAQLVKSSLSKAKSDGLYGGKVSLPNRKLNAPLYMPHRLMSLFHGYTDLDELDLELYSKRTPEVYLKWVNGILFKVHFGDIRKSMEIRSVIMKIFTGEYELRDSSIQISKGKLMMNMSVKIEPNEHTLKEENVLGVHFGFSAPVVVSAVLGNKEKGPIIVGSTDEIVRQRVKIDAQRQRISKNLKYTSGGHGRKKKMRAMSRFRKYERNVVKHVNHILSKAVVQEALKNECAYINMETIPKEKLDEYVLRNWSYYEFFQDVEYKAKREGIKVRIVDIENDGSMTSDEDCSMAVAKCVDFVSPKKKSKKTKEEKS